MWAGDQGSAGRQAARLASKEGLGTSLQGARILSAQQEEENL